MQTLRDTIIAREQAWDKAMEREHNYRQQLTRLTTETITARHLSDTRYEELKTATNALQVIIGRVCTNEQTAVIKLHLPGEKKRYTIAGRKLLCVRRVRCIKQFEISLALR